MNVKAIVDIVESKYPYTRFLLLLHMQSTNKKLLPFDEFTESIKSMYYNTQSNRSHIIDVFRNIPMPIMNRYFISKIFDIFQYDAFVANNLISHTDNSNNDDYNEDNDNPIFNLTDMYDRYCSLYKLITCNEELTTLDVQLLINKYTHRDASKSVGQLLEVHNSFTTYINALNSYLNIMSPHDSYQLESFPSHVNIYDRYISIINIRQLHHKLIIELNNKCVTEKINKFLLSKDKNELASELVNQLLYSPYSKSQKLSQLLYTIEKANTNMYVYRIRFICSLL